MCKRWYWCGLFVCWLPSIDFKMLYCLYSKRHHQHRWFVCVLLYDTHYVLDCCLFIQVAESINALWIDSLSNSRQ